MIESFGRSYPRDKQMEMIEKFTEQLVHGGSVSMKDPDTIIWVFEDVGRQV